MIPVPMVRLANLSGCVSLATGLGSFIPWDFLAKLPMISIIDDDKSVRDAADMLLKSLGYPTATFASAEEFLQSGRLHDTGCLIADVQMPGMSGVDLQSHLIANGHHTPVIFMTAYHNETTREHVLRPGDSVTFVSRFAKKISSRCSR